MTTKRTGDGVSRLSKALRGLDAAKDMEVGIFGSRRHTRGSKPVLAQLLAWHELGTATVPARRPVRTYMEGKGPTEITERAAAVLPAVLRGEASPLDAAKAIGGVAVAGVRKAIAERLPPPLAPSTLARPGRDPRGIPLLDSGQLSRAISVRIAGKIYRP